MSLESVNSSFSYVVIRPYMLLGCQSIDCVAYQFALIRQDHGFDSPLSLISCRDLSLKDYSATVVENVQNILSGICFTACIYTLVTE